MEARKREEQQKLEERKREEQLKVEARNREELLKVKDELLGCKKQLEDAFELRKEVGGHLEQLLKSIEALKADALEAMEENDSCLVEIQCQASFQSLFSFY